MEDLLQATDDKHLIFEDQFEGEANAERPLLHSEQQHGFCGKRYRCFQSNHDENQAFWNFGIFDLLTTESKSVRFQKSSDQFTDVEIYFLSHKFVLIVETTGQPESVNLYRVNLVKLNWESDAFEAVEHIEGRANFELILLDPLNQSKFVLATAVLLGLIAEYQECKLVNGKIEFGTVHRLSELYYQRSDNKLIGIDDLDRKLCIKTYNMADKKEQTFETDTYPEHVVLVGEFLHKWIVDRLYVPIRIQDSGSYGLMWSDEKTRHWDILDFSTIMEIQDLHFFNDTLIVQADEEKTENGIYKSSVKVYEISIRCPQSLRQKAWLLMIRNLKRENHPNPYKEAARYLPLNTDLRPHWFEDVEEEAPDEQNDEKSDSDGTIDGSEEIQKASLDQNGDKGVKDEAPDEQGNDGEE